MARSVFRIILKQRDGADIDAGTVELTGTTYGEHTEADAVAAALGELNTSTPGMVAFRGHVLPADLFGGLVAVLDQLEA